MEVHITDNSEEFIDAKNLAVRKALEMIGILAENYTKGIITSEGRVDTGAMRNSIAHTYKGDTAYIGSNLEYSVYHEIGTGIYLDPAYGKGRQTPWVYTDDKGVKHRTRGMKPIHMLKRAVEEHIDEYKRIAKDTLKGT